MNIEELKQQISSMDVKSDAFWDLYRHIADKYYTHENPDDFQTCAKMILGWLDRSVNNWEDQVMTVATVVNQVFLMRAEKKSNSCTGTLGFKDETFYFDIYTSEVEKDKMDSMIRRAHKALESGEVKIKDSKGRKGFGKKYF